MGGLIQELADLRRVDSRWSLSRTRYGAGMTENFGGTSYTSY
jgi:hypothetical protein